MPRREEKGQLQNANTASGLSGQFNTEGQGIASGLVPQLTQEATNPHGFSIPGLQAMNTANMQGVGGATAGAVGQGNLEAARTRNPGGFATAMDESARSGQRQLSENALKTQVANEGLRNANQQAGLSGLRGMYGLDTDAALRALGLSNSAYAGAAESANMGTAPWFGLAGDLIKGAAQVGSKMIGNQNMGSSGNA